MKTTRRLRARSLRIEALETRDLLATGITAALSSGVLNVVGTNADDTYLFRQYNGYISIYGVSGRWSASAVKSMTVALLGGNDYVSLDSRANGGNQTLQKFMTVNSGTGAGNEHVHWINAHDVYFSGAGHQLQVTYNGAAAYLDGAALNFTSKVVASLGSTGVLTVTGTRAADNILLLQASGKIYIVGVSGSWTATQVGSIVVNLQDGGLQDGSDSVSLESLANGGNQLLQTAVTVHSGAGNDHVRLAGGHDVYFSGLGHTLAVSSGGAATLDGQLLTWPDPTPTPSPTPTPTGNWFDTNIQDAALRTLGSQDYQDGLIDRSDMMGLFRQAEVAGPITATEMSDLQLIVNTTSLFGGLTYVDKLAGYIVLGNSANANYQGQTLGNLAIGSSAAQLETLVDKWFLGTDHPATGYAYSQAAGTLFVNGAAYTDVRQGALNDCAFVSSLAETALRSPGTITSMFIVNGDGTYTVRFYHSGIAEYVTVDSYLPASGGYLVYAHTGSSVSDPSNELWVSLAEKAYAQIKEMSYFGGANAYSSVEWQYAYTTLGDITGQSTVAFTYTSGGSSSFATAYNAGKSIVLVSYTSAPNVVGNHCYTVVGYDATTNSVTVFNPWGIEYGLLTLSWSQVQANFMYFDRTA